MGENVEKIVRVGWPENQPGWDNIKGTLTIPQCKPGLCCSVTPYQKCLACGGRFCQACLQKRLDIVPPWETDVLCGTFYI